MTRRLALAVPALTLALASCAGTSENEPVPPQPAGPVVYGGLSPIWDRVQIEPGLSMFELLQAWGARAGLVFTADEATRVRLVSTDVGVMGTTSVAAPDVHPWMGGLLLRHGFVMSDLTGTRPSLVGIYPVEELASAPAVEVAPTKLSDFERVPALVIQTTLTLPNSDVRTLSNTLKSLATEGGAACAPVGNTNLVVLRGTARGVIDIASALRKMDDEARLGGGSR
jgi:hypothetical protein